MHCEGLSQNTFFLFFPFCDYVGTLLLSSIHILLLYHLNTIPFPQCTSKDSPYPYRDHWGTNSWRGATLLKTTTVAHSIGKAVYFVYLHYFHLVVIYSKMLKTIYFMLLIQFSIVFSLNPSLRSH